MLGAGASISSGAPSTSDLLQRIRDRFPLASPANRDDFLEVGTAVSDHPSYGRLDLVRFVREQSRRIGRIGQWQGRIVATFPFRLSLIAPARDKMPRIKRRYHLMLSCSSEF